MKVGDYVRMDETIGIVTESSIGGFDGYGVTIIKSCATNLIGRVQYKRDTLKELEHEILTSIVGARIYENAEIDLRDEILCKPLISEIQTVVQINQGEEHITIERGALVLVTHRENGEIKVLIDRVKNIDNNAIIFSIQSIYHKDLLIVDSMSIADTVVAEKGELF